MLPSSLVQDLSAKDPIYITPLIMGATMVIQQKMTPTAADPGSGQDDASDAGHVHVSLSQFSVRPGLVLVGQQCAYPLPISII